MFHLPLVLSGCSAALEAKVLSFYFLTTVVWDFQWFLWNPAWGPRRFFTERVWWYPKRWLALPPEYFAGAGASFLSVFLLDRGGSVAGRRSRACFSRQAPSPPGRPPS